MLLKPRCEIIINNKLSSNKGVKENISIVHTAKCFVWGRAIQFETLSPGFPLFNLSLPNYDGNTWLQISTVRKLYESNIMHTYAKRISYITRGAIKPRFNIFRDIKMSICRYFQGDATYVRTVGEMISVARFDSLLPLIWRRNVRISYVGGKWSIKWYLSPASSRVRMHTSNLECK